jgi:hypothetical protein
VRPLFGRDVESMLTVFVINGTAPDVISGNLDDYGLVSNIVNVPFTIAGSSSAEAAFGLVDVSILSPGVGDLSGTNGTGFVVDILLQYNTSPSNAVPSPGQIEPTEHPLPKGLFNEPSGPTYHPGSSVSSPGLVVTLSTTKNMSGTAFKGPSTNLAGLFQITGISSNDTAFMVQNVWLPGEAAFEAGIESELTVFVVEGTAPTYVPPNPVGIISQIARVVFTIAD